MLGIQKARTSVTRKGYLSVNVCKMDMKLELSKVLVIELAVVIMMAKAMVISMHCSMLASREASG